MSSSKAFCDRYGNTGPVAPYQHPLKEQRVESFCRVTNRGLSAPDLGSLRIWGFGFSLRGANKPL
jgi:hypothetical protein